MEPAPLRPEPRWPALLAMLAAGGLYWALPSHLSVGPDWLVFAAVIALAIPTVITHRAGKHTWNQVFGYLMLSAITLALLASLVVLMMGLPSHRDSPLLLLRAAASLWSSNILVFASWYWRLDAGGPNQRAIRGSHTSGAFLFPQMTLPNMKRWQPGFVDYLFLAFNTSTAFSPTDVPVLSRWAKGLMMVQASLSLTTLAILAARAVNVL